MFNSLSRVKKKGSIVGVILKKSSVLEGQNYKKKAQVFESSEKSPILWVTWKGSKVLNSQSESYFSLQKKSSILRVIFVLWNEKGFDSLSHIWLKMVQFCQSCFKRVQFLESYWEKSSILWVIFSKKDKLILWVSCLSKKVFNSWSHVEKKR